MELTELRIDIPSRHHEEGRSRRNSLLACFSLTLDEELVIHSVKLVQGDKGEFLCMPCEKRHDHCPGCWGKNHVTARYCSSCGVKLPDNRLDNLPVNHIGQVKMYHDLVHPITNDLREYLLEECLSSYKNELAHPGSELPMLGNQLRNRRRA